MTVQQVGHSKFPAKSYCSAEFITYFCFGDNSYQPIVFCLFTFIRKCAFCTVFKTNPRYLKRDQARCIFFVRINKQEMVTLALKPGYQNRDCCPKLGTAIDWATQ